MSVGTMWFWIFYGLVTSFKITVRNVFFCFVFFEVDGKSMSHWACDLRVVIYIRTILDK